MKNPLTFRVESMVGSTFILLLAGFMLSLLLIVKKNFEAEVDLLNVSQTRLKIISQQERDLILEWTKTNNINLPSGKNKFRLLLERYPERPWYNQ